MIQLGSITLPECPVCEAGAIGFICGTSWVLIVSTARERGANCATTIVAAVGENLPDEMPSGVEQLVREHLERGR